MTDRTKGILSMIAVCVIWGLSTVYYRALSHVPPAEVLSHRTIWSLVLFGGVLAYQGRLGLLREALGSSAHLWRIVAAATMISVNWGLFIWAVQNGHVVESSLGYYIFPLVAVVMGVIVFRETLMPSQWLAVAIAAVAVALLTWGLGATPWVSLALAVTFGLYGVLKKALPLGPVVSVAAEVAVLAPFALIWLALVHSGAVGTREGSVHFGTDWPTTLLLIGAGPLTAIPLMLFARAARSVDLATVGVVGYLNPTIQFIVAVAVFDEVFTKWHAIAFAMIWTALAIYSAAAYRRASARRPMIPRP